MKLIIERNHKIDGWLTTIVAEVFIDDIDRDFADSHWRWYPTHMNKNIPAYVATTVKDKRGKFITVGMHRIIGMRILGRELLPSEVMDHIDGNGLNNRRDNLRVCSAAQNALNKRMSKSNTAGYKGVVCIESKAGRRWRAEIKIQGKTRNLGTFDTAEEAHQAYCEAAVELHGEFARFE